MTQALRTLPVLLLLALLVPAQAPVGQGGAPPQGAWRTFEGSWSASGQRQVLPSGIGRLADTFQLSGSVALTLGEGLARGYLGEAIGFDDGASISVGSAVWTDQRGDRIFSQLKGEPFGEGHRINGTITGGTGRYANLEGDYTFVWQYLVLAEGGTVQGRSIDLKGRVRVKEAGR